MQYRINETGIIEFRVSDPLYRSGYRCSRITPPKLLPKESVLLFCNAVSSLNVSAAVETSASYIAVLRSSFRFYEQRNKQFPIGEEWRNYLLDHLRFHLTDYNHSESSYNTRVDSWAFHYGIYSHLKSEGTIPSSIVIPKISKQMGSIGFEDSSERAVLGEKRIIVRPSESALERSYLVDYTYPLRSTDFIDKLEKDLQLSLDRVKQGMTEYWRKMKIAHRNGEIAISKISQGQVEAAVLSNNFYHPATRKHLCDVSQPDGINWFLAAVSYYFTNTDLLDSINYKALRTLPFFSVIYKSGRMESAIYAAARQVAGEGADETLSNAEVLSRLIGTMHARDCAAAAVILMAENAPFTSDAVQRAYLFDKNSKSYFVDNPSGAYFSVNKGRVKARKFEKLSELSTQTLRDVIKATDKVRNKLRDKGDDRFRLLFLAVSRYGCGATSLINQYMASESLHSLWDQIDWEGLDADATRTTFTLPRIRATNGILTFLRTGSLQAMADTLSNTRDVVTRCYIPTWLLEKWCERIVRRFQQKLILVATSGRPWHVHASDFNSLEEIRQFMTSALLEAREGDEFTKKMKAAFSTEEISSAEYLFVNLNPDSLGMLYAYEHLTNELKDESYSNTLARTELSAGLLSIAKLIRCVAEVAPESTAEIAIRTQLQGSSAAELKNIYNQALEASMHFLKIFKKLTPLKSLNDGVL